MFVFDMLELMQEIETDYGVEKIRYDGIALWPYFRTTLFSLYSKKEDGVRKNKRDYGGILKRLLRAIKTSDFSLFREKDGVIIFDDDLDICFIDGEKRTKLFEAVREIYDDKCIPITIPAEQNWDSPYTERIDMTIINFSLWLERKRMKYDEKKLSGRQELENILCRMEIPSFDIEDYVKKIIFGKVFYLNLFRKMTPQKIFINTYYDYAKMPAIAAAKEIGIPTIEFQHGYIGYDHYAYQSVANLSKEPYADFFFCFGNKFAETVSDNIFSKERIFSVGNGYLEELALKSSRNRMLLREKYPEIRDKKIIIVIGNNIKDMDLNAIKLALDVVEDVEGYAVVFKPRESVSYDIVHTDFYVEDEYDVYQCMQAGDLTLTNVSTCAFESLYLGTPVILDNYEGVAKGRFEMFFNDISSVRYVNNKDEMIEAAATLMDYERPMVSEEGHVFYADHNKERIKNALKEIDMLYNEKSR